jgi:folate-binding protein YgfZ
VLALLPTDLLTAVATQLRRYVLRARVQIADATATWRAWGVSGSDGTLQVVLSARDAAAPTSPGSAPAQRPASAQALQRAAWEALEIAAGLPEIHVATAGEFVAQMLNLDCIGAIAWDKGCYTGQEIIARAHYRGQMKRRMRRFAAALAEPPAPGATHTTSDGVELRVVRAARVAAGRCELLGVAPLDRPSHDELPLPYAWPVGRTAGGA